MARSFKSSALFICRFCTCLKTQRHLTILKRRNPVALVRLGMVPHERPNNFIYENVFVDTVEKIPPIDCILTDHVDGLGERGDLVSVKRRVFRHELYPAGLAVYASPENIAEFEKESEATKHIPKLSRFAYLTWLQLWGIHLDIPMSGETTWTLDRSHVQVAFRLAGIEVDENCLTLPEEEITSPQDLSIIVNVNGIKEAVVPATIYTVYKDPSKNPPREPRPWLSREECYNIIKKQEESRATIQLSSK